MDKPPVNALDCSDWPPHTALPVMGLALVND